MWVWDHISGQVRTHVLTQICSDSWEQVSQVRWRGARDEDVQMLVGPEQARLDLSEAGLVWTCPTVDKLDKGYNAGQ